jgi:hypothetical protein
VESCGGLWGEHVPCAEGKKKMIPFNESVVLQQVGQVARLQAGILKSTSVLLNYRNFLGQSTFRAVNRLE